VELVEGPRPAAGAGAAGVDQRFVDVEQNELRRRHDVPSLSAVLCFLRHAILVILVRPASVSVATERRPIPRSLYDAFS
jgi:hypothetical protein